MLADYPGYEIDNFESEGGAVCSIPKENRVTNSSRQPVTQKAVGNPNKGRPASTITKADTTPNRLDGKPVVAGPSDES